MGYMASLKEEVDVWKITIGMVLVLLAILWTGKSILGFP